MCYNWNSLLFNNLQNMKKTFTASLAIMLLFLLCACTKTSVSQPQSSDNDTKQTEARIETPKQAPIKANDSPTTSNNKSETNIDPNWKNQYSWLNEAYEYPSGEANFFIAGKLVDNQEKIGLVDTSGKVLISFEYASIGHWNGYVGPLFLVSKSLDNAVGVIDKNNKVIIPLIYQEIPSYSEENGLFTVKNQNKLALINLKGQLLTKFEYDTMAIQSARIGTILVSKNNKFGLLSMTGQPLIPNSYDKLEFMMDDRGQWKRGSQCGQFTLINGKFTELVPSSNCQ